MIVNINLIKKDFLELLRSRKLLIIVIVLLFISVASPIFAKLTPKILSGLDMQGITITLPEPTANDSVDQFMKNISQIGMIALIFLVSGSVTEEKNRRNLEILLTKPISRDSFIVSKFITIFLAITSAFILSSGVFYLYTASMFSYLGILAFVILVVNVLLYVLAIVSVTILGSTIAKNSIFAAGIGFISFISFSFLIGMFSSVEVFSPGYILSHYKDLFINGWSNEFITSMISSFVVILCAIVSSILIFRKQEIER